MAEAENISKILRYIEKREQNLSRYSDKLRQSIIKIVDVFGPERYCRSCDQPERSHDDPEKCAFKPKIQVSLEIIDDVPFYTDELREEDYYLATVDHYLKAVGVAKGGDPTDRAHRWTQWFDDCSREKLKALVKSGRLIPFLQKVVDTLQAKCMEYEEVSEVAEKLAKAVSP